MTDMKSIADLRPCGRRWLQENHQGAQMWCRPPVRPTGLADAEAIKDAAKWFRKRKVSPETCRACVAQEALRAPMRAFEISDSGDPILDRKGPAWDTRKGESESEPPRVLENGTIVYEPVGRPPHVPPGYKRFSDEGPGAWTLVRIEPLCRHCVLKQVERASCDCVRIIPTCTFNGKSKKIQLEQCTACPNK